MTHEEPAQLPPSSPENRGEKYINRDPQADPRAEFPASPGSARTAPEGLEWAGLQSYRPEATVPPQPPQTGADGPQAEGGPQPMPTPAIAPDIAASALGLVPKRAVSYLRVSTKRQAERGGEAEGFSIPAQRDANRKKAQALGAFIVKEFVDRGESARSTKRPELQQMLEYLAENQVDYVIVHKVDRLARNREDDVMIGRAIAEAGAVLVSTTENIDQTPSGMLLHGIMASIAEFYSRNLVNEVLKGMNEKVRRGGTPSKAPLGYRNVGKLDESGREVRTVIVDPERGEHITWAFQEYATGDYSLRDIAQALASRGLRTPRTPKLPSRPVNENVLQKILTNPYYMGIVTFQGAQYPGLHTALIDGETFERVQSVLRTKRFGERTKRNTHFLKSTLYCGSCESRMFVQLARSRTGEVYPYFVCGGRHSKRTDCQMKAVLIGEIERQVEQIYDRLLHDFTPEFRAEVETAIREEFEVSRGANERVRQALDVERQKLEREQARLLQAHYADAVPLDLLKREQDRIRVSLIQISKQAAALTDDQEIIERTLTLAIDLIDNCAKAYRLGDGLVKRMFNQVFFERLLVMDNDDVRIELAEPIATITSQSLRQHVGSKASAKRKSGTSPKGRTADGKGQNNKPAQSLFSWIVSRNETLVPLERLELPTVSLGRNCSSIELQRLAG